jgi:hypothetical protein
LPLTENFMVLFYVSGHSMWRLDFQSNLRTPLQLSVAASELSELNLSNNHMEQVEQLICLLR